MRRFLLVGLLVVLGSVMIAPDATAAVKNYRAVLHAGEEVADEPVVSRGRGVATFQLNHDGTELRFKLIVANIENVTMAHIHLAAVGVNGPVVVWLRPDGPPSVLVPGRSQGPFAEGVITEADLVGPLAGLSLADLLEAMEDGDTYVNVHTSQYPNGEIRGQIR